MIVPLWLAQRIAANEQQIIALTEALKADLGHSAQVVYSAALVPLRAEADKLVEMAFRR